MPFRRERPLHERLAEQGGLVPAERPHDPTPRGWPLALHGHHRPREWDAVVSAEAPLLHGDAAHFVALPDGTLVVEEDVADGALGPLADAVEAHLAPPYRAEAVRRGASVWAAAARRIEVVELLEEPEGDSLELGVHGGERSLVVDGEPSGARLPSLERLAEGRGLTEYVVRAERLDGALWEVALAPL